MTEPTGTANILQTAASQSSVDTPETTAAVDDDLEDEESEDNKSEDNKSEDNKSEDDESEDDESELPSLYDIYGYDDDEDNEEAAFDDILKLQERGD